MKFLKILAIAAIAAIALMAMAGVGSAGAETTLCKGTEDPCSEANRYGAGTEIAAALSAGTKLVVTPSGEQPTMECGGAGCNWKSETTTTPSGNLSGMSFTGCNNTTEVLEPGTLQIHWDAEHNASITIQGLRIRTKALFGAFSCDFGGVKEGLTLTGGTSPKIDATATIPTIQETGFIECPSSQIWHAAFSLTKPTPLYVSKGL